MTSRTSKETSYWMWLPVAALVVGVLVAVGFLLGRPPWASVLILIFFGACAVLVGSLIFRRPVPHSQCPICLYSLVGLPEPVCPECGGDFRKGRPSPFLVRSKRRVCEMSCLVLIVASGMAFVSHGLSKNAAAGLSRALGWPTMFERSSQQFVYIIKDDNDPNVRANGIGGWARPLGGRLYITAETDSYPNKLTDPRVASVTAVLSTSRPAPGSAVPNPAWRGEVMLGVEWSLKPLSRLDTDGLVDAVSEQYLTETGSGNGSPRQRTRPQVLPDDPLLVVLEDPAKRSALKAKLAELWEPDRPFSRQFDDMSRRNREQAQPKSSEGAPGVVISGDYGGSSSSQYEALSRGAMISVWVTSGLGWLVTVLFVAAIMCWYGRPMPSIPPWLAVRWRAIENALFRRLTDIGMRIIGGKQVEEASCRWCAHPVTGLKRPVCLECGASLAHGVVKAGAPRPEKRRRSGIVLMTGVLFLGLVVAPLFIWKGSLSVPPVAVFLALGLWLAIWLLQANRSIEPFRPYDGADGGGETPPPPLAHLRSELDPCASPSHSSPSSQASSS